jgi:2-polyprenyl-6-hydroxyphenyl methylase / 3-demethylubiquinone-9 3-methyltransferase
MSNVDPHEIEKFESVASRWWDPESEFKPLHDMNPVRLSYICSKTQLKDKHILDIGCGGGILTESMAPFGASTTGIDLGKTPLIVAQLHAAESKLDINYQQISAEELASARPNEFSVVTCMEMLEHVPDPAAIVKACSDLAKPGADIFFSTISRTPKAWLAAIVGAEYVLNLLPKGTHEFKKFIRPSELSNWCRKANLDVKEITGIHYNPFAKTFKIGPGVDINYIIHCQKSH